MSFNRLVRIILILVCCMSATVSVEAASTAKPDSVRDRAFIKRISIHTNAVEWVLTLPNVGIEFDLQNSEDNRYSILLQGNYNWNTKHQVKPRYVFNAIQASVEFRKYWRTGYVTKPFSRYNRSNRDTTISRFRWMFKRFRRNVLSGRTFDNPRTWRAYYVGAHAGYDQYSVACFGKGVQGKSVNIGITGGWSVPIFLLPHGQSLDLDLGLTLGIKVTQFDRYRYIGETGCYEYYEHKPMHVTPFPVIHQARVGFVYRFRSISKKVQHGAERYNEWDNKQQDLIFKRRSRQDSISMDRQKKKMEKLAAKNEAEKARQAEKEKAKMEKEAEKKKNEEAEGQDKAKKSKQEKVDKKEKKAKGKKDKKAADNDRNPEAKEKKSDTKVKDKKSVAKDNATAASEKKKPSDKKEKNKEDSRKESKKSKKQKKQKTKDKESHEA